MPKLPARITTLLIGTLSASQAAAWPHTPPRPTPAASDPGRQYATVVRKVAAMPENDRAVDMVSRAGLSLLNVLWEDTGRWEGIVGRSQHQRRHHRGRAARGPGRRRAPR